MSSQRTCNLCGTGTVAAALPMGAHPVSNRFSATAEEDAPRYDLTLGQCDSCHVVQLMQALPRDALIPPFPLYFYEPEAHLDTVVDMLLARCGLGDGATIAGLTYKDDSTLDRLRARGFDNVWRVDMMDDLGVPEESGNIESVQAFVTPERMRTVAQKHGQVDLLLCRHIFEHTQDTPRFCLGLAELVREGGYLLTEVPDCGPGMRNRDYTMVWEEHVFYPTPGTTRNLLQLGGFSDVDQTVHPMPFEDCIVTIARKDRAPQWPEVAPEAQRDAGLLRGFARDYEATKRAVQGHLQALHEQGERIAMFGAGHLCCAFVYYYDVADFIRFVADDTPSKQGQYLPGTSIPIVPGERLIEDEIGTCILAVSVNTEPKIVAAKREFLDRGGRMRSAFRSSERSIFNDIPDAPTRRDATS